MKKFKLIIITGVIVFLLMVIYFLWPISTEQKILNDQAVELIYQKRFDEAEILLKESVEKINLKNKKEIASIYENLGTLYENKEEIDLALINYKKALTFFNEKDSEYHSFLGLILLHESQLAESIEAFKKAIEIDSNNFSANNNLGLLYLGQLSELINPNYSLALDYNEKAYKVNKNEKTIQNLAVNYYLTGNIDKAFSLFQILDTDYPENAVTKYFLGLIYYIKGDLQLAKPLIKKGIELEPDLNNEEIQKILNEVLSD